MLGMSTRGQVRVYLSSAAKKQVDQMSTQIGISHTELLSRICEWFAVQPKGERLRMLGILTENEDVVSSKASAPKNEVA